MESAAYRATHRTLSSLWAGTRRHGHQLPGQDNEAQRLTLEILTQKLDLFGNVLDMSDDVLHAARSDRSEELTTALGPDFEKQLHRIWDRARSVDEVEEELRRLRESMEERRQELTRVQERTTGLIESRFDDSVQQVFRQIADELPATLAELDADLERVVIGYLQAHGVPYTVTQHVSRKRLKIPASPLLPEPLSAGLMVAMGRTEGLRDGESLHVAHPLVIAALDEARTAGRGGFSVRFRLTENAPEALRDRSGARGRLALTRVSYRGFEREDRLVATALFEDSEVLRPADAALELVQMPCEDIAPPAPALSVTPDDLDEVVDEELFFDQAKSSQAENDAFQKTIDQLDQYMEDRLLVLRRTREDTSVRLREAEERRAAALGADARAKAEGVLRRLEAELEDSRPRSNGCPHGTTTTTGSGKHTRINAATSRPARSVSSIWSSSSHDRTGGTRRGPQATPHGRLAPGPAVPCGRA